jgi:hypothetical protein
MEHLLLLSISLTTIFPLLAAIFKLDTKEFVCLASQKVRKTAEEEEEEGLSDCVG